MATQTNGMSGVAVGRGWRHAEQREVAVLTDVETYVESDVDRPLVRDGDAVHQRRSGALGERGEEEVAGSRDVVGGEQRRAPVGADVDAAGAGGRETISWSVVWAHGRREQPGQLAGVVEHGVHQG